MLANFRTTHGREIILALAGLALIALTLLAAGLKQPDFRSGENYVVAQEEAASTEARKVQPLPAMEGSGNEIFILLLIVTLMALIGLMTKEGRKRVLWALLWFAFMIFVSYILSQNTQSDAEVDLNPPEAPAMASDPLNVTDATEVPFEPPKSNTWASFAVSFVLVAALGVGGWFLWRWIKPPLPTPLQEIGYAARLALNEMESGEDWHDTVIRAYVKMSNIVNTQRGLQRPDGMTASEFAQRLERAGLPADSVRRLTRLFESVRYSGRGSSQEQAIEAAGCLTSIIEACGVDA